MNAPAQFPADRAREADGPPGITFEDVDDDPVFPDAYIAPHQGPRAQRHDGWTPECQRKFLEAIAEGQTVDFAAARVGMAASGAYALRRRATGASFALGWAAANLLAREHFAATLYARAFAGQVETVTRPDGSTVMRHRYDNRLAAAMLARLDRQAEDPAQGAAVAAARLVAQDFDAYLDLLERDEGPARAGLFLGNRSAGEADLAPIVALARADRYVRTGAALASEVDVTDLDPAARATWSAEQWQRAEAAGLVALAPDPVPAPAETAQASLLSLLHPMRDPDAPVWWDERTDQWRTDFPPPDDFFGEEDGVFGEDGYSRALTVAETAAYEAEFDAEVALRRAQEGRQRDAYFAEQAALGDRVYEASAASAAEDEDFAEDAAVDADAEPEAAPDGAPCPG